MSPKSCRSGFRTTSVGQGTDPTFCESGLRGHIPKAGTRVPAEAGELVGQEPEVQRPGFESAARFDARARTPGRWDES